jgi:aminomethyltransferase
MVDFGGWHMPVQYTGILDEHAAVRTALGVFDISHMGQFFVRGSGACAWLDRMLTNNVAKLDVGAGQYTFLLNEHGGVIDDLILYRIAETEWLLVVNAAKIDEDFAWMQEHLTAGVVLENQSDVWCGLAVQGPRAAPFFRTLFDGIAAPARNQVITATFADTSGFVCRTGYTGEDGFELFFPGAAAVALWRAVLETGAKPCGLGARDTLRLEMCYPLNGSDLSPERTPLEAGLGFFVDLSKPDFIGRAPLAAQKAGGLPVRLAPLKIIGQAPPLRAHYPVVKDGAVIGELTSGTLSPSLKCGIGLAYLPTALARVGETVEIDVRGRTFPAEVCRKPFYQPAAAEH